VLNHVTGNSWQLFGIATVASNGYHIRRHPARTGGREIADWPLVSLGGHELLVKSV
jgi:hypothetical protein